MAISLETQEILFAFEADNKDNYESWGKYELDELQDAYAELPEEDKASTTGQRIKERIEELESGKDQVQELRHEEEVAEQQGEDIEQEEISEPQPIPQPETELEESGAPKQKTPTIITVIITGDIVIK